MSDQTNNTPSIGTPASNVQEPANLPKTPVAPVKTEPIEPSVSKSAEVNTKGSTTAQDNVAPTSAIDIIKQKTAELIVLCEALKKSDDESATFAIDAYKSAGTWALKAAEKL